jgi:hypothetical protein
MKMAKNIDVIKAFANGDSKPKTKNLHIEDDKLFNYNTCIAERWEKLGGEEYGFVINVTRYSQSTTTIQNKIVDIIPEDLVANYLRNIPMGADSLVAD